MAQQYPLGTGNGGPYTPGPVYYPSYQQNGIQQPAYSPQGFAQSQMSPQGGYNPSSGVNIGRFESNAQIHPVAPPFQFPPSDFGTDIFRQFANPAIIPPPLLPPQHASIPPQSRFGFQSMPMPNGTVSSSAFPQFNPDGYAGSNIHSSDPVNTSNYFPQRTSGNGNYTNTVGTHRNEMDTSGEEIDRNRSSHTVIQNHSQSVNVNASQEVPSHVSQSKFNQTPNSFPQSNNNFANGTHPQSHVWSKNTDTSTNSNVHDAKEPKFNQTLQRELPVKSDATENPHDAKSVLELRQLTKDALSSLYSHEIRFQHLIAEGLNLDILLQLYEELGIQIPGFIARNKDLPTNVQHNPNVRSANEAPATNDGAIINHIENEQSKGKATDNQVDHLSSKQHETTLSTKKSPQLIEVKSSLPKTSTTLNQTPMISPSMERKDRIAQLLAAKTGKPSPSRESPGPPSASVSPAVFSTLGSEKENSLRATSNGSIQEQKGQESHEIEPQNNHINQNTEMVKPRTLARIDLDQGFPERIDPHAKISTSLNTGAESSSFTPWSTLSTPSREELERSNFMNSIPGLFLTSAEQFNGDGHATKPIQAMFSDNRIAFDNGTIEQIPGPAGSLQFAKENVNDFPGQPPVTNLHLSTSRFPLKRPLASDAFEEDLEPEPKRPNTAKEEQEGDVEVDMVQIDDASEGEIVESDEYDVRNPIIHDIHQSRPQLKLGSDLQRTKSFPERNVHQQPTSGQTSMDDISVTALSDNLSHGLYRAKQSEIEEMRKKIAEMELRKQLKRTVSGIDSPQPPNPGSVTTVENDQSRIIPTAKFENVQPVSEVVSTAAPTKIVQPIQISKLTPAQLAEKAAALKAGLLKQRANRQKLLQDGLPDLNSEVQKTKDKLTEVKAKLEKIRQDAHQYETDALRARELERQALLDATYLEQQLEAGISGQKQFSDELQSLRNDDQSPNQRKAESPTVGKNDLQSVSKDLLNPSIIDESEARQVFDQSSGTSNEQSQIKENLIISSEVRSRVGQVIQNDSARGAPNLKSQSLNSLAHNDYVESGTDTPKLPDPISFDDEQMVEPFIDDAEQIRVNSTLPDVQTSEESDQLSKQSSMDIDENAEGSVSMSDSGSDEEEEEYEPVDTEREYISGQISEDIESESEEYDPEEMNVENDPNIDSLNDETGEYEPAENIDLVQHSRLEADIPVDNDENFTPASETQRAPLKYTDSKPDSTTLPETISNVTKTNEINFEADNSTKETITSPANQPAEENIVSSMPLSGDFIPGTTRYVPYQSPLQSFRSFRFHPKFNETVKDGYRSLTYSNSINWKLPLCPTELAGETCTDPNCEEQHFRQLGLTDDKILVQMSSTNDIKDKARRDRYLVGLKQVIASLRQNGVKEFENVANALSTYRREFFAEPESS